MSVDLISWPVLVLVCGTVIKWIVVDALKFLNMFKTDVHQSYIKLSSECPEITGVLDETTCIKSREYHKAYFKFGLIDVWTSRILDSAILFACVYPYLLTWLSSVSWLYASMTLTLVIVAGSFIMDVFSTLLGIPFTLYENFKLEAKFGFNTMTLKLWFTDLIKSFSINEGIEMLSIAVMNTVLCFVGHLNIVSILAIIAGYVIVSKVMSLLWMNVISPLFNKYTPMEDNDLKKRLTKLIVDAGYKVKDVYVVDESKRSKHGNAYFTGFGKQKRIVIYDNLLKNSTDDEIYSILAHEVGHLVHNDVRKEEIVSIVESTIILFVIAALIYTPAVYHAFGFNTVNDENVLNFSYIGFCIVNAVIGSCLWVVRPVSSWWSRKMEYAADRYAAEHADKNAMISSLIKLNRDNLNDIAVHPWYYKWFYSHPSLSDRIKAIRNV